MAPPRSITPLRNFGFLLRDVSQLFARNFERHAAALDLTLNQCRVLCYLQRQQGLSQARLAELTDTDPMTLGRLLERMVADGLVERRDDPHDRRAHCLYLRPAAAPVLDAIWRHADGARAEAFHGLGGDERAELMRLLLRLQANLEALLPPAAERPAPPAPAAPRSDRC